MQYIVEVEKKAHHVGHDFQLVALLSRVTRLCSATTNILFTKNSTHDMPCSFENHLKDTCIGNFAKIRLHDVLLQ